MGGRKKTRGRANGLKGNLLSSSFFLFQGGKMLSLPKLFPQGQSRGKSTGRAPLWLRAKQSGLRDERSLTSNSFCPHRPTHCAWIQDCVAERKQHETAFSQQLLLLRLLLPGSNPSQFRVKCWKRPCIVTLHYTHYPTSVYRWQRTATVLYLEKKTWFKFLLYVLKFSECF